MSIKEKLSEIGNAADTLIPIENLHLGKDLKKLAEEVEAAQEVMYGRVMGEKELLHKLERSYVETNSEPIVFTDGEKIIRYMNEAAIAKYEAEGGKDLIGKAVDEIGGELVELHDEVHVLIGYYVK